MKHEVKAGQTDYTVLIFIPDPASTDGSGKTGLVAADLTVSGVRVETDNDVTVTDYTSSLSNLSALTDAHADWGLKEVSSTLAPGIYRLDIADAIFAAGAWSAVVYVMVTSSAAVASPMEFVMVPELPLTGVLLAPTTHTSAVIPTVSTLTGHTPQTGDSFARIGAPTGASIAADLVSIAFSASNAAFYSVQIGQAGDGLSAIPKTGYKLASDGLDSVATTAPAGVASNFREMLVQVWRRFFKKTVYDITNNTIKTYADNGTTVITTQTTAVSATEETQGAAS